MGNAAGQMTSVTGDPWKGCPLTGKLDVCHKQCYLEDCLNVPEGIVLSAELSLWILVGWCFFLK